MHSIWTDRSTCRKGYPLIPTLAFLICGVGVAALFYLDRDKSVRTDKGLWVPVIWIALAGSKPLSEWFGMRSSSSSVDGSPLDAAVFGLVGALGLTVLLARRRKTSVYIALAFPIVVYCLYCLISITWSPFPVPALKRWVKDLGDVTMAIIVVTDRDPLNALRRLFSRLGFILLPLSVFLIRYTTTGRVWDADGNLYNTGIASHKNSLGLMVFLIALGALWNVRSLIINRDPLYRRRRLVAQLTLLAFSVALLKMAHSSTSVACFMLGSCVMLTSGLRVIGSRRSRVYSLSLTILVAGALTMLLGGTGDVAGALGRQSTLTGRTDIWTTIIPTVPNPIIGAGFESYWNSPGAKVFAENLRLNFHWYHAEDLNEAHNGYIETYLNLGVIGVGLILLILITGYHRACKASRCNREIASLMLAYIITAMFYSVTEAGFRILNPMWIFFLLAFVSVSGVTAGLFGITKVGSAAPPLHRSNGWVVGADVLPDDPVPVTREIQVCAWAGQTAAESMASRGQRV